MTADRLIDTARAEFDAGIKEFPAGSNNVKYNTWYYGRPVSGSAFAWCVTFVQWCFDKAGLPLPLKTASCSALTDHYKGTDKLITQNYRRGDIIMLTFNKERSISHTGIIERVDDDGIVTIEGNTSLSSNDNGGAVMRRKRQMKNVVCAVRPYDFYEEDDLMTKDRILQVLDDEYIERFEQLPDWARPDIRELLDRGIINGGTDTYEDPDDINMYLSDIKTVIICKRMVEDRR